ncbi:MAG: tripartite tricarboxylate transporter substrate binding protein [Burkholderiales bacterium]|nr:tripartite tricarboxylate transporter substrate binding protein [Burkholderiales bacterium]
MMRRIGSTLVVLAALAGGVTEGMAQTWPARPVRLVVGFAPGGAADYVARNLAEPLGRALGQSMVVENRAGAGSSIAADHVAKAAPDGYTLLIASPSSISVNPAVNPKLGYSARDLLPVTRVSTSPLVVAVNPALKVATLAELIALARRQPGKLNYATSGNGSAPHLAAVLFARLAGVDMVHVPYKGGGPAVQSVVAGDTQLTFGTPPSVLPMIEAKRLIALASTSRSRSPLVPGVPGMSEAGLPDYEISFWYGLFFPAATPLPIARRLHEATARVLESAELRQALAREGTETVGSRSPEDFAAFIAEDAKFWVRLVRDAKLQPE